MTFVIHLLGAELLRFSLVATDDDSETYEGIDEALPFGFTTEEDE